MENDPRVLLRSVRFVACGNLRIRTNLLYSEQPNMVGACAYEGYNSCAGPSAGWVVTITTTTTTTTGTLASSPSNITAPGCILQLGSDSLSSRVAVL